MEHIDGTKNSEKNHPEQMVVGANQLAHFNVRCPACHKLFRIESREVKSSSPQFDCSSCKTRFTFDFPPSSARNIETRAISQKETVQIANLPENLTDSVGKLANLELKKCPKCEALNPRLTKECLKCGVLFEKVENLPMDSSLGAFPSLVKAWQDLMSDYSNLTKHVAFVDRCEDLQALPFALKKYETLKEVQPADPLAQQMFHRVLLRNLSRRAEQISWLAKARRHMQTANGKMNWSRIRKISPFALSFALILVGLSHHSARNMVGMGAAILFLTLGITVFIKGRISLHDFW